MLTLFPKDVMQEKIKDIIDHQFDLEIYLKHREIAAIREEIGKAEDLISDIRLAVRNGMHIINMINPNIVSKTLTPESFSTLLLLTKTLLLRQLQTHTIIPVDQLFNQLYQIRAFHCLQYLIR
jgi:hypothetical protein